MQNRYLLFAFLSFFIVGTAIGQKKSKKKDKTLMEAPAAPKDPLAGVTKLSSVEGITEYSLTNGLNVLLYPDNEVFIWLVCYQFYNVFKSFNFS